jgi:hypothetical protein
MPGPHPPAGARRHLLGRLISPCRCSPSCCAWRRAAVRRGRRRLLRSHPGDVRAGRLPVHLPQRRPRFDKPIFIYWLQSIGYLIFGASEWAFRLPSALAAIVWSYATWLLRPRRFGEDAALIALAVASTALGPFAIGRAATADALLNCLLALTLFDVWRHLESGAAPRCCGPLCGSGWAP